MSVTAGVVLYGPDGRTLISSANPLAVTPTIGGSPVVPGNPFPILTTIGVQALAAAGTAAAPGAGSAVASIVTPAAGMYRVTLVWQLSGTAETLVKNLRLAGTTFTADFPTIGTAVNQVTVENVSMDGAANLRALAVAAATAGSVYTVSIVAVRLFKRPVAAPISDVWTPSAGDLTRRVAGAGVTLWGSVAVENATDQLLYVAQGDTPPTGLVDAYWIVTPGGFVTIPLGAAAVSLRLAGAPTLAGSHVQTVLATEPAPASGNTGQVSIAQGTVTIGSGNVTITSGQVDVQNVAGQALSTAPRQAAIGSFLVPAFGGGTSGPITVPADAASLIFEWPGANPVDIRVLGVTTGARYMVQTIDGYAVARCPVDSTRDAQVQIFASQRAVGLATTLLLAASTAPATLASPDLFPFSQLAAIQYGVKNVNIVDVSGKQFFVQALAGAGPVALVPAVAATAWSGYSFMAIPDAAVAGNWLQVGGLMVLPSAGGPFPISFDFRGAIVALTGAALNLTQIGPLAVWRVHLTAAQITT